MEICLNPATSCISYSDSQYFEFLLNSEIDLLDLSTGMKFLGKIFWGLNKNLQK